MKCSEARERILAASIDDEVREHMRGCDSCAELGAADGSLALVLGRVAPPEPPAGGFDRLAAMTREADARPLSRLQTMPTPRRYAAAAATTLVLAGLVFAVSRRPDWAAYPMMQMALVLGAMIVAAGFAVVLSMPPVYRPERPLAVRLAAFAFLLAVPFLPALLPAPDAALDAPTDALKAAGQCIGFGALVSFPILLMIRGLQRERTWGLWTTLFAALAAAIGANIALQVHCSVGDATHVALGHAILGILYAALAWVVVRMSVR